MQGTARRLVGSTLRVVLLVCGEKIGIEDGRLAIGEIAEGWPPKNERNE